MKLTVTKKATTQTNKTHEIYNASYFSTSTKGPTPQSQLVHTHYRSIMFLLRVRRFTRRGRLRLTETESDSVLSFITLESWVEVKFEENRESESFYGII